MKMKKIFIITMILSSLLNAAKLKYTSEKTDSYKTPEGDIIVRYAKIQEEAILSTSSSMMA